MAINISDLTQKQIDFLSRLDTRHGEVMTRGDLGCVATDEEDRARQWCRQRKFAEYVGTAHGAKKNGWRITAKGILLLRGHSI